MGLELLIRRVRLASLNFERRYNPIFTPSIRASILGFG